MRKQIRSVALAACVVAAFSPVIVLNAQAKQQCSPAIPSNPQGHWSWRVIDGRKCWYEGKPMLSKSSLEWPALASAQLDSNGEIVSALTEKPINPLDSQDSQTSAPTDSITFDVLWRSRVEQR
jgi:hypothetical protein